MNVQTGQLAAIIGGVNGDEMGHLGQMIDYDPNGVMTLIRPGQPGDEIHADFIPLPFRNVEGL